MNGKNPVRDVRVKIKYIHIMLKHAVIIFITNEIIKTVGFLLPNGLSKLLLVKKLYRKNFKRTLDDQSLFLIKRMIANEYHYSKVFSVRLYRKGFDTFFVFAVCFNIIFPLMV